MVRPSNSTLQEQGTWEHYIMGDLSDADALGSSTYTPKLSYFNEKHMVKG